MELLQLRYFMAVAKNEHMTLAAKQMHVSQPTISQAISRLETELGVQLFDREGRNIKLNVYGYTFMAHAQTALESLDKVTDAITTIKESQSNIITISYWNSSSMVPRMLTLFSQKYPYIKFKTSGAQKESDFTFSFATYDKLPYPCEILLQEDICVAVPYSNPLSSMDSVDLAELKDEDFICVTNKLPFRARTDEFCHMAGFEPKVILENEDYRTLEHLLSLGIGVSFWPKFSWRITNPGRDFKLLKINKPICMRTIYLSWSEKTILNKPNMIFREFAKSFFVEMKLESMQE